MQSALKADLIYVAIVFTVGFLLGTLRVLGLAPILGERLAVMIELPFMLGISVDRVHVDHRCIFSAPRRGTAVDDGRSGFSPADDR
jgi:hypothetical protein